MIAHSRKVVRYFFKIKMHNNKNSVTIFCFSAHLVVPLQPIYAVVARTSKLRE